MDTNAMDKKTDSPSWTDNHGNIETEIVPEQEKVIEKLEKDREKLDKLLTVLKNTPIKNEECFLNIKKPLDELSSSLDELSSSLKYLPVDNSFDNLPTEITTNILSYMSNYEAFVAANVCQKWRDILETRVENLEPIKFGNLCIKPVEMLEPTKTLNLDVPLKMCHPIKNVDFRFVIEAFTRVSNVIITDDCDCDMAREYVLTTQDSLDLADALCKVEEVKLWYNYKQESWIRDDIAKRLFENILTREIKMKRLHVGHYMFIWNTLINPQDLPNLFDKMEALALSGCTFSLEQYEVARSIQGMKMKGVYGITWFTGFDF